MQTIITLIISILLMRIASEEIFDCTGYEEDSFHPMSNRNDCRFYWHCVHVDTVHMQAVKRACPPETEFDFRTSQCEWANSVSDEDFPLIFNEDFHLENLSISTTK